jgi:Beta-propeller repeat
VDKNGNVFVTGTSSATNGASDYATVAYSKSGSALWTNRYDGPGHSVDIASAVTVDPNGRIYVTGSSSAGVGGYDYATVAYALSGAGLWTNRYSGPANGSDNAIAIVADSGGTVYVTGASASSNTSGIGDFATVAYSNNGIPLWTNRYNGPANGDDKPLTRKSLAIAGPGSIVVVGASDGDFSANSAYDYAIVKYASYPQITASAPSNGVVQMSWEKTFLGWHLEIQTNSTGLGTNWIPVPDSALTNLVIIPATGASAFFRLAF